MSVLISNKYVSQESGNPKLAVQWVRQAGRLAASSRGEIIQKTQNNEFVTNVDEEVERLLVKAIRSNYPDHTILSEGIGLQGSNKQHVWVIDPIDGTRAYTSGLPTWGISLGYFLNRQIKFGVFFMPDVGEMYVGRDEKAYLNGKRMRNVFPLEHENSSTFLAIPSKVLQTYDITYPRIRSFGSMAVHLAYVTRGIAIGTLTRTFRLWDIAGMLTILQATGICIRYLDGSPFIAEQLLDGSSARQPCIACHPSVMEQVRSTINVRIPNI